MNIVPAIILAGGKGKRMGILCRKKPKPVLPFGGNYRIIDFTLSNCIHSHITNIAVMVDYQHPLITRYLKKWHSVNGHACSLQVLPPDNGSYNGTADAVYRNLDYVKGLASDVVLVLAGDHIYNMDYGRMIEFHHDMKADATISMVNVPLDEAQRFGTVITDQRNRVLEFKEKSAVTRSNRASMGIYVFNRDFLADRLIEDAARTDSSHDFGYSLLPHMVESGNIFACIFDGYWQDIGTINSYYEAHMGLLESLPHFVADDSRPILTINNNLPPDRTGRHDNIVNSIISPGCVINGFVSNSVLSPGVVVERQAEVMDSIVMADSKIGYHSIINRCILDEGVRVGKYCYLGLETDRDSAMDITVLGQNVETPDYVAIGSRSKVLPNTVAADFDSKFIRPDSVVARAR